jgi:alpha-galactosidase
LHLRGLDAKIRYRYRTIHGAVAPGTPDVASGAYWMSHGVDLVMKGDMQAAGLVLEREGGAGRPVSRD